MMKLKVWHKLLILVFMWTMFYACFVLSSNGFSNLEARITSFRMPSTAAFGVRNITQNETASSSDGGDAQKKVLSTAHSTANAPRASDLISEGNVTGPDRGATTNVAIRPQSGSSLGDPLDRTVVRPVKESAVHSYFEQYYQHLESQEDLQWCKHVAKKNHIVVGKSWGKTGKEERRMYNEKSCDSIVALGSQATCHERFGWGLIYLWLRGRSPQNMTAGDAFECVTSSTANEMCRLTASMDHLLYSTGVVNPSKRIAQREFRQFFLQTYGRIPQRGPVKLPWDGHVNNPSAYPHNITPGGDLLRGHKLQAKDNYQVHRKCDYWEMRPTFVLSPDLQTNVGHYMNDLMNLWSAMLLAGRSGQDSVLLHMEGLRRLTPGSVVPHRIYDATQEDYVGPFEAYVLSWFSEVVKPAYYNHAKVCYKELYMPFLPGLPWIWGDFDLDNKCSLLAPSPLYQSFNLFLRERWRAAYGPNSLPDPQSDLVHVVLEFRSSAKNILSSVRLVLNKEEIADRVRSDIPGVNVTVVDLGTLSHMDQVALVHSAGVFVSMHGGGAFQIFNAAVGTPNCCAMVELFPDKAAEGDFPNIRTIGNIARHMGVHYSRYDPPLGSTTASGTTLNATHVVSFISAAVDKVRTSTAPLHDPTERTDIESKLRLAFGNVWTLHNPVL